MKVSIDTKKQTIEITEPATIVDFLELLSGLEIDIQKWTIVQSIKVEEKWTTSPGEIYPWGTPLTPYWGGVYNSTAEPHIPEPTTTCCKEPNNEPCPPETKSIEEELNYLINSFKTSF